jgi:hypothetical protein
MNAERALMPDFSGTWTVNPSESHLGVARLRELERGTLTIAHTGGFFHLSRESWIRGHPHRRELRVVIDGAEHGMESGGRTIHFQRSWRSGWRYGSSMPRANRGSLGSHEETHDRRHHPCLCGHAETIVAHLRP